MKRQMMNIGFATVLAMVSAGAMAAGTGTAADGMSEAPVGPSEQGGAYGGSTGNTGTPGAAGSTSGTGMTGTAQTAPSFKSVDTNHDGSLSVDEYSKAGGTPSDFQQLDANHDGKLEKSEVAH